MQYLPGQVMHVFVMVNLDEFDLFLFCYFLTRRYFTNAIQLY